MGCLHLVCGRGERGANRQRDRPEKRCGKTVLLGVLARLSCRPLAVSNIAPAALFRALQLWQPTLLIDEVDAFLAEHEEARGILNAGFTRDTAFVIRCVGDDHTPTRFNVWGAKALCGIGKIADTLADRSIPLRLRRKMTGERTVKIRHADPGAFAELVGKLARFALDNRDAVRFARPAEIEGLNDRANDCWEPLLAVAEVAGVTGHASPARLLYRFTAWRKTPRASAPNCWHQSVTPSTAGAQTGYPPPTYSKRWPMTRKPRGQPGTVASR